MLPALLQLLITLLIVGVIYWAVTAILGLIPLPEPIGRIVNIIMILILAIVAIYALAGLIGGVGHFPLLR
jgi:ABC-type methionine transport system permease subunit